MSRYLYINGSLSLHGYKTQIGFSLSIDRESMQVRNYSRNDSYMILKKAAEAPDVVLTAEEAATMIARAAALCGMKTDLDIAAASNILEKFDDFGSIAHWSVSSVGFCVKEGILDSMTNVITPKENPTRETIAVMIYKMLGKARLI